MTAPEFNPTIEYARDLEVKQNAFALDREALIPWYEEISIFYPEEKQRRAKIAHAAIDSQLSLLTTSKDDVALITSLLTLDKALR